MAFTTSESLLFRLRHEPPDEDAWGRFVERYEPLIRSWCRERGLAPADVEDICQEVLARLVTALRSFSYDPSKRFRGWLRIVTVHALEDDRRRRQRQPAQGSGDTRVLDVLLNQEGRADLAARLDRAFDLDVFERARSAVQARVAPHTWQAFVLSALEAQSVTDTARALAIEPGMVYVARCRVTKLLKREIQRLSAEIEESSTDDARRLSGSERVAPLHRPTL